MEITGKLLSAHFEEDTLTIQMPKGFWSKQHHVIRSGAVIVVSEGILPPRNKQCNECVSGLIHETHNERKG